MFKLRVKKEYQKILDTQKVKEKETIAKIFI